jgi:hypothetical protein
MAVGMRWFRLVVRSFATHTDEIFGFRYQSRNFLFVASRDLRANQNQKGIRVCRKRNKRRVVHFKKSQQMVLQSKVPLTDNRTVKEKSARGAKIKFAKLFEALWTVALVLLITSLW